MKILKALFISHFIVFSSFADFTNQRIKYSNAKINNQFDLALRLIDYRIPLANIQSVQKDPGQYVNIGDYFKKEIKNHQTYQDENQNVLDETKDEIDSLNDGAPASNTTTAPPTPIYKKDLNQYFTCMNDNLVKTKRLHALKKMTSPNAFQKQELNILNRYIDETRARNGISDSSASLCSKFLGKASFDKLSSVNTIKLIYAFSKLNIDQKKHLLAIQIAANHKESQLDLRDVWLFTSKYMMLTAFTKEQSLPDRNNMVNLILAMREKLRKPSEVLRAGEGTSTTHYVLTDIRQDMLDSYDIALELVNEIE